MWELLGAVVPLALGAAITPTLFALQVLVVSGPRWQARATAVVLGTAMVFAVVAAAVLGGLSQLPDAGTGGPSRYEHIVQTVCGALLLGMSVWMLRPHPSADDRMERKVQGYAAHASPTVFAGLAAYMSITDFSSLVLLVPALHDVTRSAVAVSEKALVVAFLMACLMAPVLVPVLAVRVAGHRGLDVLRGSTPPSWATRSKSWARSLWCSACSCCGAVCGGCEPYRSPSNSPDSRRAFIVDRKRAASAPSTKRWS